ncbi:MAG: uracil-DNA glycosylase [Cyanobacteriota bacterium]|nr:uracil-DNA glycosylase [Cyanobacteriota bacterium]
MAALHQHCQACRRCGLASQRQQVVIGRGNPQARLLLIGEAPGADEDASGLPFVGRSGQLLDRLLHGAGLDPQRDLYICNAIKCRPPGNRKPKAAELAACRPWLAQQITLLNPAVVLLLGATALEAVLGLKGPITRLRGQWLSAAQGPLTAELAGRQLMPLLHPSYLLRFAADREGSPRHLTRGDLQRVQARLVEPQAEPAL